jgi:hypothetical protein
MTREISIQDGRNVIVYASPSYPDIITQIRCHTSSLKDTNKLNLETLRSHVFQPVIRGPLPVRWLINALPQILN